MSKPKNMTPEQEAAWREKRRAYRARYYTENREKERAMGAAYYAANRKKTRAADAARQKAWRKNNPDKLAAQASRAYRADPLKKKAIAAACRSKKPELYAAASRKWRKDNAEKLRSQEVERTLALTDSAVRKMLTAHDSGLTAKDITAEMIELKREQILLKRLTRQLTKELENE